MDTPLHHRSEATGRPTWRQALLRDMREVLNANLCCWLTKKGAPCRSLMRKTALDDARGLLVALEGHAFSIEDLEPVFDQMALLLLCKRWHKEHADRLSDMWLENAKKHRREYVRLRRARTRGGDDPPTSRNMGAAARGENSARVLTVDELRWGQSPWAVGPDQPLAILRVRDESGECKLQSFGPSAHREHLEDCPICLDQLQEAPHETLYVQCVACARSSHLECVERWLRTCESGACLFCAFW